jgi:predicted SnoaL-like aldol condensation-catalyzing enzyme
MRATSVITIIAAALTLISCQDPDVQTTATTDPAPASVPEVEHIELTATELANRDKAVGALPAGAKVAHAIADGDVVMVAYATNDGLVAEAVTFATDGGTQTDKVEQKGGEAQRLLANASPVEGRLAKATEQANREAVLAFLEAVNNGSDLAKAASLLEAGYVDHAENMQPGPQGFLALMAQPEVPKRFVAMRAIAAQADVVGLSSTVETKQPNGTSAYSAGFDFFRVRDGKITDRWRINY